MSYFLMRRYRAWGTSSPAYVGRFLLLAALLAARNVQPALALMTPNKVVTSKLFHSAAARGAAVFIDVENVRGKTAFALSHADLVHSAAIWANHYGLGGRVSLIVDHGMEPTGYYYNKENDKNDEEAPDQGGGMAVIFAGPSIKADDVIARDVTFCQETLERDVLVVTADTELIQRCKRAAKGKRELNIVPPISFIEDVKRIVGDSMTTESPSSSTTLEESKTLPDPMSTTPQHDEITSEMESEIKLGAMLIGVESQLKSSKKRKNMSPKKRKKLKQRSNKIRAKLGTSGPSTLDRATSILSYGSKSDLDALQQKALLEKWESLRKASGRNEQTGDRVLLAERLRRELDETIGPCQNYSLNYRSMVPAEAHACHVNQIAFGGPTQVSNADTTTLSDISAMPASIETSKKDVVRLVIVSDTHGFEKSLTSTDELKPWKFIRKESDAKEIEEMPDEAFEPVSSSTLPDGDLLLHLGDFAIDRGGVAKQNALVRFDKWLSLQPHSTKIVVRGNHDPYNIEFPLSKAIYVTKPIELTIGNQVLAIIPYQGLATSKPHRSWTKFLPESCDILASHEPPSHILDKCVSGERAGSTALRRAVEKMKGSPPKLWVCGHIHEGRGSMRTRFGQTSDSRDTLVINAANANPGRATHLAYGSIVVDVSCNDDEIVDDDSVSKAGARKVLNDIPKRVKQDGERELLLAIDLGLRSGASLFDDNGTLLRYEQLRFEDSEDLFQRAPLLIDSWENSMNMNVTNNDSDIGGVPPVRWVMSYLAVEGGGDLWDAWSSALEHETSDSLIGNQSRRNIQLLSVRPNEWRAHLLSQKERSSSRASKEAARLIARQVVSEFGEMSNHQGKFETDVAESVAMGYHVASRLGWITRHPAVQRYTNGQVVVPK